MWQVVCKVWGYICEQTETSCSHEVCNPVEKAANKHTITQDNISFQIRVFAKKKNNRVAWEYITGDILQLGGEGEELVKEVLSADVQ